MQLSISHHTTYNFDTAPNYGLQQLRLTPKTRAGQSVITWNISVEGGQIEAEFLDFNNNHTHLLRLDENSKTLKLSCEGRVQNTLADGILGPHEGYAPLWYFKRSTLLTKSGKRVARMVKDVKLEPANALSVLHDLSAHIISNVAYETGQTSTQTTAEDAIAVGKGVCQDHAHIFISCARVLGLPARYVSGYLMMTDRIDQDATHAWAEVWVDNLGWVGFDVSNQVSPDEKYVRIASGLDYTEAAPISGITFGQVNESVDIALRVQQQ